jgi:hypothetical protein
MEITMTTFQDILDSYVEAVVAADQDFHYGDLLVTEEEVQQVRTAFECRLAVQQ